jgi:hypothetical protein
VRLAIALSTWRSATAPPEPTPPRTARYPAKPTTKLTATVVFRSIGHSGGRRAAPAGDRSAAIDDRSLRSRDAGAYALLDECGDFTGLGMTTERDLREDERVIEAHLEAAVRGRHQVDAGDDRRPCRQQLVRQTDGARNVVSGYAELDGEAMARIEHPSILRLHVIVGTGDRFDLLGGVDRLEARTPGRRSCAASGGARRGAVRGPCWRCGAPLWGCRSGRRGGRLRRQRRG